MLLERINDGAFVTDKKLDFCNTNWTFPYELFVNLTNQPSQKLIVKSHKSKVESQMLKDKSWKLKIKKQKLKVKSWKPKVGNQK